MSDNDEVRRKLRDITVNQAAIEVLDSFLDKLSRSEESDFEKASEENNLAGQFLSIAIRQHIIRIKEQNREEKTNNRQKKKQRTHQKRKITNTSADLS